MVTVKPGTSVLEAAEQAGIMIPALCRDPELTSPGACRLCVVEVEGMRNLPASCVTEVRDGMVVSTGSDEVVAARQTILDLLLASHPEDCLTCEKSGQCLLQDYAYQYGVRESSFVGPDRQIGTDYSNPFIARDEDKCILCGKCIRVCDEIQGRSVIDFSHRGSDTRVQPPLDCSLEEAGCIFCGSCIAVCPVGALTEKDMKGKGRRWELERVTTICPYCGTGCSLDINVMNDRVVGITSSDGAVNGRHLCSKGRFGYGFIDHPERLKTPLIRKDGQLVEASWDEAIRAAADGLTSVIDERGSDSVAVLSSARMTTEENYLLSRFTRAVIGTNNLDHCARL